MKVTGKSVKVGLGVWLIVFAVISAAAILSGAKDAKSPLLFVGIFGGLFALIPAVLGIGIVYEHLHNRNHIHTTKHR
jgi:hypothetical protein